jgi:hypothetical protein
VHAGQDSTLQLVLAGCGGRGTGAAGNALAVQSGPINLIAMADVFSNMLNSSYDELKKQYPGDDKVYAPEDCKFIGFDGYRKPMDLLKPGDVAILTTPLAFRWPMYSYTVEKALNVFME